MTWVACEGYEGLYAVSDDGQVMSMNYAKSGLPGLMGVNIRRGYESVFFRKKEAKGKWITVHTLVAAAFVGPRPKGCQINHINGVKTDNRVSNLEYCTPSENKKHAFRLGLECNKGERHSQAKLNDEAIFDIRTRWEARESQISIARTYNVTPSNISQIVTGKRWVHVQKVG